MQLSHQEQAQFTAVLKKLVSECREAFADGRDEEAPIGTFRVGEP